MMYYDMQKQNHQPLENRFVLSLKDISFILKYMYKKKKINQLTLSLSVLRLVGYSKDDLHRHL